MQHTNQTKHNWRTARESDLIVYWLRQQLKGNALEMLSCICNLNRKFADFYAVNAAQ